MFFRARQTKLSLLFVLGVLLIVSGFARAAGVRPLVIEMNVRPGDVRDFEMALIPGLEEELVDLTLTSQFSS